MGELEKGIGSTAKKCASAASRGSPHGGREMRLQTVWAVAAFSGALTILIVLPVSASNYLYHEISDPEWSNGSHSDSGSGADSSHDTPAGKIDVKAEAFSITHDAWAEAEVYVNFSLGIPFAKMFTIEIEYHIKGYIFMTPLVAHNQFYLRAELFDNYYDPPAQVAVKDFESETDNPLLDVNQTKTKSFDQQVLLVPGHIYQLKLRARAEIQTFGLLSEAVVDFMSSDRHIDWIHARFYSDTYEAYIKGYCRLEDSDPGVSIDMDGSPTGQTTPHLFTGLNTPHTFFVPNRDPSGHYFSSWDTGEKSRAITVNQPGAYTANYGIRNVPALNEVGLILFVTLIMGIGTRMIPQKRRVR